MRFYLLSISLTGVLAILSAGQAFASVTSDEPAVPSGPVVGATGYVFAAGIGWEGGHMVYCPPPGEPMNSSILYNPQPPMIKGKCGNEAAITAQEYVDITIGHRVATVIGVAPFMVRNGVYGVIYYKENSPRTEGEQR